MSMSRDEILHQYKVNDIGIIRNPGKFEGEMLYVPYFYDWFLDGSGDEQDDGTILFDVCDRDREIFPELDDAETITLTVDSNGFVYGETDR